MSMILEVETSHGKRSVICDNYAYRLDHYLRGGNISWRCTQKRCKARIRTNGTLTEVLQRRNQHDHESDGRKIERQILRARSKRKAVEDTNEKLSKIVCSELENVEKQFLHPTDLKNITKAMSRLRRKHGIGRGSCSLNGVCLKPKPKSSEKKNNSGPDLSNIIKVEPIDVDELFENDGLEVSFCVTQNADSSAGRAEGGGSQEKGQGGMDIMELLQGAHQRFESQKAGKGPEAKETSTAGKDSGISPIPEPSSADGGKLAGGTPVLEELFKNARLNQKRQQKTGVGTEQQTTPPPSSATAQSIHSPGEAETVAVPRVPAPYSLLASGGMTVEEFERRQRHPYQFQQEQQQEESTTGQEEKEMESVASGSMKVEEKPSEGKFQETPSTEQKRSPPRPLELLTPGDFEKSTPASSRPRAEGDRLKGVMSQPDVLMRPQDFTSPLHLHSSSRSLSRLHLNDPPSPASPEVEPLTRPQFQQALIHMIRSDEEFVYKLHEAYLDNFQQLRNRVSKR